MTTDSQPPPPPQDPPFEEYDIYSWYLHFRGEYHQEGEAYHFKPSLRLKTSYAQRLVANVSSQAIPDEAYLDIIYGEDTPLALEQLPTREATTPNPPYTRFQQGGFLAEFSLEGLMPQAQGNLTVIGSTENVSIRATLRNEGFYQEGEGANDSPLDISVTASLATIIDELPYSGSLKTPENVALSAFKNLRPIIYLEQNSPELESPEQDAGGFFLLAEITDWSGYKRVLLSFTTMNQQHWVVSRPYFVSLLPSYTIRVHQDGDITRPRERNGELYRYFEFWVNNLPVGIYGLPTTEFPFKKSATKVGIGYWPRDTSAGGPIYYTGSIDEIIFDPYSVCPPC